jgi:hypothetical protein
VPFWKPKRTGCLQNDVRQLFAGEVKDGEPVAPGLAEA